MPDELKKVEVRLYFPQSLVLSDNQHQNTPYRDLICTVELLRYGHNRNSQSELAAQGIVRHLRIILIADKATREWIYFDNLEKKVFRQLQTALANEVCEKLQLRPKNLDPTRIAPKDMLLSMGVQIPSSPPRHKKTPPIPGGVFTPCIRSAQTWQI